MTTVATTTSQMTSLVINLTRDQLLDLDEWVIEKVEQMGLSVTENSIANIRQSLCMNMLMEAVAVR